MHVRLWCREGSSDKVYELHLNGTTLDVKWGRRGAKLQEKSTTFDSAADARAALDKTRKAKLASGYRDISDAGSDESEEVEVEVVEHRTRSRASSPRAASITPTPARAPAARTSSGPPAGVMLAKAWEGSDPAGWWMSEKLDGMRAYWNGSTMYTRNGNEVAMPDWFSALLPRTSLDGELFIGRGKFQDTISVVRKLTARDPRWSEVTYVVFDAPDAPGGCEARFAALKRVVDAACASWSGRGDCPLVYLEQTKCMNEPHLKRFHVEITKLGGEGVMLRKPGSAYSRTRTSDLLKVKDFNDAEARITGYTAGTGKHAGRLGAYEAVLLDSGVAFKIGTGISDAERDRPKRIGTVVTVKFQELTRDGVPRFPSLVGARDYE